MSVSVRMDESLVEVERAAAKGKFRAIHGQFELWAKVSRVAFLQMNWEVRQARRFAHTHKKPRENLAADVVEVTAADPDAGNRKRAICQVFYRLQVPHPELTVQSGIPSRRGAKADLYRCYWPRTRTFITPSRLTDRNMHPHDTFRI